MLSFFHIFFYFVYLSIWPIIKKFVCYIMPTSRWYYFVTPKILLLEMTVFVWLPLYLYFSLSIQMGKNWTSKKSLEIKVAILYIYSILHNRYRFSLLYSFTHSCGHIHSCVHTTLPTDGFFGRKGFVSA